MVSLNLWSHYSILVYSLLSPRTCFHAHDIWKFKYWKFNFFEIWIGYLSGKWLSIFVRKFELVYMHNRLFVGNYFSASLGLTKIAQNSINNVKREKKKEKNNNKNKNFNWWYYFAYHEVPHVELPVFHHPLLP